MESSETHPPLWFKVTLQRGEDLFEGLRNFLEKESLREAHLLSCIGSLERIVLAYPKSRGFPPEVGYSIFEDIFEINGISGNIKRERGEIKIHLHGSVSKGGNKILGGAIAEGTRVFKVAELLIVGIKE